MSNRLSICAKCRQVLGKPAPAGGTCPYCGGTIEVYERVNQ